MKDKYQTKIDRLRESIKKDKATLKENTKESENAIAQKYSSLPTEKRIKPIITSQPLSDVKPSSDREDDFNDSDSILLKELDIDTTNKNSSPLMHTHVYEKEMSIKELQIQQKMQEINRLESLNDSLIAQLEHQRPKHYEEVLVRTNNRNIHKSLQRYNRRENRSVERVERSKSSFSKSGYSLKPTTRNKSITKIRARPAFNIVADRIYGLNEKEENYRWNDITSKALEEQVRSSIQDVERVLNINTDNDTHKRASFAPLLNCDLPVTEESTCQTPSPKASFNRFRQLVQNNHDFKVNKLSTPHPVSKNKQNTDEESSELETKDEYYMQKLSLSPNLRYKQNENTAVSSNENKIMVTDEFKLSNFEAQRGEKPSLPQCDLSKSSKKNSMNQDSLCEYKDTDNSHTKVGSPTLQQKQQKDKMTIQVDDGEDLLEEELPEEEAESPEGDNEQTEGEQSNEQEDYPQPMEEHKVKFIHPKLEFISSHLPLHSISEDVNSPYFASSTSNFGSYVRRQSNSKKNSDGTKETKTYSNIESPDPEISADRNLGQEGGTVNTITSISDNFCENNNIDKLEQKLDRIVKKRNKRIELFESYLNDWEQKKLSRNNRYQTVERPESKVEIKPEPKSESKPKSVTRNMDKPRAQAKPSSITPVKKTSKKLKPNVYMRPSGILKACTPVLSSRYNSKR